MSADCLDIIHAALTNRRSPRVFTPFLVIPKYTRAAARHGTGHAVIRSDQPDSGFILQQQAMVCFIRYAFGHGKKSRGWRYVIRVRIAAPVIFPLALVDALEQRLPVCQLSKCQ